MLQTIYRHENCDGTPKFEKDHVVCMACGFTCSQKLFLFHWQESTIQAGPVIEGMIQHSVRVGW